MRPEGDPPLCDCHQRPMYWSSDSRRKRGGRWKCSVLANEVNRRHRERYPERKAALNARRLFFGDHYIGSIGFTDSEVKEMISGSSD